MEKQRARVEMCLLLRRSLPGVLRIEEKSFEFPWFERDFLRHLRDNNCIGTVAECEGEQIGFLLYRVHRSALEIVKFAVDPSHRRCGIATRMVTKLIRSLTPPERARIVSQVPESQLETHLLLRKLGFQATRILPSTHPDSGEDLYVMEFRV